jgi:Zn-dependent protease with chaperone function
MLGHEAGHYVLHHIPKEFALDETLFLVLFYVGFLGINGIVEREAGARHPVAQSLRAAGHGVPPVRGVEGVGDLASLPIVLLVLTVLVFVASPAINGISRHYEQQADQFGLEVAYGIVANPNTAEVQSLQIMGEEDLEDPDPNPLIRFWLYTHPPLEERIRFAASYRPWAEGKSLEFVPTTRE